MINTQEKQLLPNSFYMNKLQQKELQAKYFSNPDMLDQLINSFHNCLQSRDPLTTMNKSNAGATGFTFLCGFPSTSLPDESASQPMNLVLKWQNTQQCAIEKCGSKIFQHFGFASPKTLQVAPHQSNFLLPFAEEKNPVINPSQKNLSLIAMPRLHALNFEESIKNRNLKRLSKPDFEKLAEKFGEIASIDFLIGNDDRFVKFKPGYEKEIPSRSSFNSGNILIELENDSLVEAYPIDNCLTPNLMKKTVFEDLTDIDVCTFFSSHSISPLEENKNISSKESEESEQKLIETYNKIFTNLVKNYDEVSKHITENINDTISKYDKISDYQTFHDVLPDHLKKGMIKSYEKIKNFYPENFFQYYKENLDQNLEQMKSLVSTNTLSLKSLFTKDENDAN